MKKCNCWEEKDIISYWYGTIPIHRSKQICNGTRERDECSCNGDESKCNFYPQKRKEKQIMNTAEMWIKAQKDGKTYKCYDMLYNRQFGFHDRMKTKWNLNAFDKIDDIFYLDTWELKSDNEMTKTEAEKKFGIKIVGE